MTEWMMNAVVVFSAITLFLAVLMATIGPWWLRDDEEGGDVLVTTRDVRMPK